MSRKHESIVSVIRRADQLTRDERTVFESAIQYAKDWDDNKRLCIKKKGCAQCNLLRAVRSLRRREMAVDRKSPFGPSDWDDT